VLRDCITAKAYYLEKDLFIDNPEEAKSDSIIIPQFRFTMSWIGKCREMPRDK
jgi:hypothetical protein